MFLEKINLKIKRRFNQETGFTLLEMVVAVAIFIILILLITDIFLIATKSHRRTMEVQKVLGDARFAMEAMAREVRMDAISYDYVGGIPAEELGLRDINNSLIVFKKEDSGICPDNESRPCLVVGQDIDGDNIIDQWASITPVGVSLVHLQFYIAPNNDPFFFDEFDNRYGPDIQPRVTIILATRSVNPPSGEVVPEVVYLQTTVTSRAYKR